MESLLAHASSVDSAESPAQKQARLRRERREAKTRAQGSSRLDQITQLSGRPVEPASSTQAPIPNKDDAVTSDPEVVDIARHASASGPTATRTSPQITDGPTEADIRALLRSGVPPPGVDTGSGRTQREDEDPMMRLLQQMLGGVGGEPGAEGNSGLPPGLAAMLGDMGDDKSGHGEAGMPGIGTQAASPAAATSAYVWRITHAISALALGIYLVSHASFSSSSARLMADRSTAPLPVNARPGAMGSEQLVVNMFWIFATTELVLQGTRFFLEQGKDRSQGRWLQLIGGLLPEPWRGWLKLADQYSGIWKTFVEDAMVVVFILGIVGWWRET